MMNDDYSNQSEKFLRKADRYLAKRIKKKIGNLKENPFPSDCKRYLGNEFESKSFRVRVGDYRIIYSMDFEENILLVQKIEKRSQIYLKEESSDCEK